MARPRHWSTSTQARISTVDIHQPASRLRRRLRTMDYAERKRRFGRALHEAMNALDINESELGEKVGKSQTTISNWLRGVTAPKREEEGFAVERALELPPGTLTRLLGYLPPEAFDKASFEAVLLSDDELDEGDKEMLLAAYRAAVKRNRAERKRAKGKRS